MFTLSTIRTASRRAFALALIATLAACGGGGTDDSTDDGNPQPPPPPPPSVRAGQLQSAALLGSIPAADIAAALSDRESLVEGVVPRYSVTAYRLEYLTSDADGNEVRASGLVSVPQKPAGATSPVLGYQHGTLFRDAEAPSNNAVASEVAVVLASLGYIVLAPDYVGFGASKGTPHPYLLAAPSAAATVDFLGIRKSGWAPTMG